MRSLFVATLFAILAVTFIGSPASGQKRGQLPVFCMKMEQADKIARKKFKEQPAARGIVSEGAYILMYKHPRTNAFTIMVYSAANGQACVIASGKGWTPFKDNSSDL